MHKTWKSVQIYRMPNATVNHHSSIYSVSLRICCEPLDPYNNQKPHKAALYDNITAIKIPNSKLKNKHRKPS